MIRCFKATGLWLPLFLLWAVVAQADHNVYLPLVPNTALMQQIIKAQEYNWCADARSSAYPSFLSQLRDVNDQYTQRTGIRHRQVDYADPACQVKHTMPDNHGCSGCAAWVFYANWPVTIEYKYQLGYVDWRTTQGHELGHALLGLHEQYRDSGGSIGCTGRQDTVMDCGSGVRYPTTGLDVPRGCAVIVTGWCGQAPGQTFPYWDYSYEPDRLVFADGWMLDFDRDWWFNPAGVAEWMARGCCGDRWNDVIKRWVFPDGSFVDPSNGIRSKLP